MLTIYVEQYGAWWKFTPDVWRAVLLDGVAKGGHSLPDANRIARRSPLVGVADSGSGHPSYFPMRNNVLVYHPLDWDEEDYTDALVELDAPGA
jgi:hypothetical protein